MPVASEQISYTTLLSGGLQATAIGTVAAVAVISVAKAALWGGKKVMQMANEQKESTWKTIALKIAAIALYTIGALATIVGVGIAIGTTIFLGGSLGIIGGMMAGPYGAIPGAVIGLFAGAMATGGIIYMAWNTVMDKPKLETEI